MKRYLAMILCGMIVAACSSIELVAQGKPAGGTQPPATPAPVTQQIIAKYVGAGTANAFGITTIALRVVIQPSGQQVELLAQDTYSASGRVPSPAVEAMLKASEPGDYFRITVELYKNKATAKTIDRYTLKPGEDEPNVYIFDSVKEEKVNNRPVQFLMANKFEQPFKFEVPKQPPSATTRPAGQDLQAALGTFKTGDSVEIQSTKAGATATLKSIKAYEAPKDATFGKKTTLKVGDKDMPAIELQLDGQTQTLPVRPQAVSSVMPKLMNLKAEAKILIKTETDDKGTTFITELRVVPVKPPAKGG